MEDLIAESKDRDEREVQVRQQEIADADETNFPENELTLTKR